MCGVLSFPMALDHPASGDGNGPSGDSILHCPVCGGTPAAVYPYLGDSTVTAAGATGIRAHGFFSGEALVCGDCGHGWMAAMPPDKDLETYYRATYWSGRTDSACLTEAPHYRYRAHAQIRFIELHLPPDREIQMLEIGAGSAGASRRARELLGERIHLNVCEPAASWRSFYAANNIRHVADFYPFAAEFHADHIHASHWLEHVRDLPATIAALAQTCRDHATVFIEVPNTGHNYWKLGIPGTPHLHFFTAESLRRAFVSRGFACCEFGEFGLTMQEWRAGRHPGEDDHQMRPGGMWLRALFRRL